MSLDKSLSVDLNINYQEDQKEINVNGYTRKSILNSNLLGK